MVDEIQLTPRQQTELTAMLAFGATSEATALDPYGNPRPDPMVQGRLQRMGFATSKSVRPAGGSQRTIYWLTPAGVERAAQLRDQVADPLRADSPEERAHG